LDRVDANPREALWFESTRTLADPASVDTVELYALGLRNVNAMNQQQAFDLFEAAWERRSDHDPESEGRAAALAAGVAFAAHLELFDVEDAPDTTDEVLADIDPEAIAHPERGLYEWLIGGDPEESPEELRADAETHSEEGNAFAALEAETFAVLLDELQ
jgi:hypothetical protein